MANILWGLLLTAVAAMDPPLWPQHFSQSFQENYFKGISNTSATMYYDFGNNRMRVDRNDGSFDPVCSSVMPTVKTSCSQLIREGKLYLVYPQQRYCCMCCDAAHGCGVLPRDWLKEGRYQGQEYLSGEFFNKWIVPSTPSFTYLGSGISLNYYSRVDAKNTPRRIEDQGIKIANFIMSSYNEEQPPASYFELPSYCQDSCSSKTVCEQIRDPLSILPQ